MASRHSETASSRVLPASICRRWTKRPRADSSASAARSRQAARVSGDVAAQAVERTVVDDLPSPHHRDAPREPRRELQPLLDQHDRDAVSLQRGEACADFVDRERREAFRRFVDDQHARAAGQRPH